MKHNSRIVPGCLAMVVKSQMGNSGKVVTVSSWYTAMTEFDDGVGNQGAFASTYPSSGWMCEGELFIRTTDSGIVSKVLRRPVPEHALMRLDDPDMAKTIEAEKNMEKEHG